LTTKFREKERPVFPCPELTMTTRGSFVSTFDRKLQRQVSKLPIEIFINKLKNRFDRFILFSKIAFLPS